MKSLLFANFNFLLWHELLAISTNNAPFANKKIKLPLKRLGHPLL